MNNFERQRDIQELADSKTKFELASMVLNYQRGMVHIGELSDGGESKPSWYVSLETDQVDVFENDTKVYIYDPEE